MRQKRLDSTLGRLAKKLESRALTLVLPEATDERVLAAARVLFDRQLAQSVLIGAKSEITAAADAADIALDGLTILDPQDRGDQDLYVRQYLELRPESSPGIARRLIRKPLFLGGSLLRANQADAMLAGVSDPTARVIEACLMTVGLADGIETPSSCFLMIRTAPDGAEQCLIFADCAVNVDPDADELADIAVASAMTCREILGEKFWARILVSHYFRFRQGAVQTTHWLATSEKRHRWRFPARLASPSTGNCRRMRRSSAGSRR